MQNVQFDKDFKFMDPIQTLEEIQGIMYSLAGDEKKVRIVNEDEAKAIQDSIKEIFAECAKKLDGLVFRALLADRDQSLYEQVKWEDKVKRMDAEVRRAERYKQVTPWQKQLENISEDGTVKVAVKYAKALDLVMKTIPVALLIMGSGIASLQATKSTTIANGVTNLNLESILLNAINSADFEKKEIEQQYLLFMKELKYRQFEVSKLTGTILLNSKQAIFNHLKPIYTNQLNFQEQVRSDFVAITAKNEPLNDGLATMLANKNEYSKI